MSTPRPNIGRYSNALNPVRIPIGMRTKRSTDVTHIRRPRPRRSAETIKRGSSKEKATSHFSDQKWTVEEGDVHQRHVLHDRLECGGNIVRIERPTCAGNRMALYSDGHQRSEHDRGDDRQVQAQNPTG